MTATEDRQPIRPVTTREKRRSRRHRESRPMLRLELSGRGVIALLLALVALWLLARLWQIVILIIVSVMLAVALMPLVHWLMRRGLTRGTAVAATGGLLVVSILLLLTIIVPSLISQGRSIRDQFPEVRSDIAGMLRERNQHEMADQVEQYDIAELVQPTQVVSTAPRAIGIIIGLVTLIVLTIYILADAERVRRFVYFLVPFRYHVHVDNLLPALATVVGGYLRGQLITSALIASYTFVVLLAVGAPNALGLAVLAGIADIIPLVGAFIAVIPATLAALSVSLTSGIIVLALLLAYQQVEDRILVPKVYGRTLRLPAVVVFLAVIIGAKLMGIVGALLALPAAAALRVILLYAESVSQGRIEPPHAEDDLLAMDEAGDARAAAQAD